MAEIHLSAITKRFGAQTVLSDIHLHVNAGEFLTLLGPSGCGKSTLLRIIAGLDRDHAGSVHIARQSVDRLKPKQRNIAMVFQSYALYPHMTVEQNIALPLVMRRLAAWQRLPLVGPLFPSTRAVRAAIRADVHKVAETLEIAASLHRKPGQLSGGQRQRVAVARAMVRRPTAFLMDEPLSNLDARLRAQTRTEIADLHRRLGVTFVYVTHDQAEAMTMSDRVAVMSAGRILQIGRPHEIYVAPADTTVARLVGTPRMNLMAGVVRCGTIDVAGASLPIAVDSAAGTAVIVGFRPENATVMHRPEPGALAGRVRSVEHMGPDVFVHVDIPGHAEGAIVRCAPADYSALSTERIVHMAIASEHALVFDASGKRIVAASHQAGSLRVRA